jgi:hypothetical protein
VPQILYAPRRSTGVSSRRAAFEAGRSGRFAVSPDTFHAAGATHAPFTSRCRRRGLRPTDWSATTAFICLQPALHKPMKCEARAEPLVPASAVFVAEARVVDADGENAPVALARSCGRTSRSPASAVAVPPDAWPAAGRWRRGLVRHAGAEGGFGAILKRGDLDRGAGVAGRTPRRHQVCLERPVLDGCYRWQVGPAQGPTLRLWRMGQNASAS